MVFDPRLMAVMEVIMFVVVIKSDLNKVLLGHLHGWVRLGKTFGTSNMEVFVMRLGFKGFSRFCSEIAVEPI